MKPHKSALRDVVRDILVNELLNDVINCRSACEQDIDEPDVGITDDASAVGRVELLNDGVTAAIVERVISG